MVGSLSRPNLKRHILDVSLTFRMYALLATYCHLYRKEQRFLCVCFRLSFVVHGISPLKIIKVNCQKIVHDEARK